MKEIRIPDIGGATDVDVIEIAVKVGDSIVPEQALVTLESDKASMEVPSPSAGVVEAVVLQLGDKVSEGDVILQLQANDEAPEVSQAEQPVSDAPPAAVEQTIPLLIPEIGTDAQVDVIEVAVKAGDSIQAEQALLTLESEKASMEVPAAQAGVVQKISVQVGDKVGQGDVIGELLVQTTADVAKAMSPAEATKSTAPQSPKKESVQAPSLPSGPVYAGPAVRRFARELGVDLTQVQGRGHKGRIQKSDVQAYVKVRLAAGTGAGGGFDLAKVPEVDFAKFGAVETQPLNKIKRLTARNLHRNWVLVPHVTQFDEADITELEAFRKEHKTQAEAQGFKLTPLVFIMKAVVAAMQKFPQFNASLSADGQALILKKYFNIGIAVDTDEGLVVPVLRDVDGKGALQIAKELGEVSDKARRKALTPADMQGGCFTISSLGGISGTAFTPIVNMPDVAILGVSRAAMKPVYTGDEFVPRLMLPLSLSYDHRVIDGAEAARFSKYVVDSLSDIRNLVL